MHQEAADELACVERHHPVVSLGAVKAIILPLEGDALVVGRDQAAVGDGDAVGVARKIAQDFLRSPEWTWHRRPSLCCAAVPNKPRRLLDWSAPCACRRTAALRHNERQQAFPGQAFETDTREPPRREGSWAGRRPSVSRPERCRHPARSCGYGDGGSSP